ncbi:hypothetical protein Uis1B_2301 [Bifidobacterium margollesii]|uniref:Uncharacterized protein n=1 Tax=Bifidobacterium margollesii TaxID=2020964 RepID=A0A2N5J5V3_9BIFI|nr:hypothetical protein [Bifidobacterium margollesii]PLS29590.1 hypothetical protein Uis1B_2301 [Bifidobacterium margollesii]
MSGWVGTVSAAGCLATLSGTLLWWAFARFGGMTGAWTWLWRVAVILMVAGSAAMTAALMLMAVR